MLNFSEFMSLNEELYFLAAQEVLCERAWSDSDGNQPWLKEFNPSASDLKKMDAKELDDKIQAMVDKYAKPVFSQFTRIIKKCATSNAKVLTDMKTIKSIKNKIERGKQFGKMTDIVRGAILCSTPEDVEKVNENLRKNARLFEIEKKEKGKNEWGYYGSNHYLIDINGVLCEIQVMTKKLWTYKELGHEIYTKNRLELAKNPDLVNDPKFQKEIQRSKLIFSRGNGSNVRF